MIKTLGGHVANVHTRTLTHTQTHAHMVLYITIRFSIHSNAGLGWNPMERNKETSEYSSNGDFHSSLLMDVCRVQLKGN